MEKSENLNFETQEEQYGQDNRQESRRRSPTKFLCVEFTDEEAFNRFQERYEKLSMDTRTEHGPSVRLWYTVPIDQPTAQREFERGEVRLTVRDKEPKGDKDILPASRLLRDLAIFYERDDLIPMSALRLSPSPEWACSAPQHP